MKHKIYTKFPFFIGLVVLIAIAIPVLLVLEYGYQLPIFGIGIGIISVFILVLIFRIIQLIFKAQLDRQYDVQQVEALLWMYQQVVPSVSVPTLRDVASSPDFWKVITETYLENKPTVIVEAGSGVSSIILSEILHKEKAATLHYALDHEKFYADQTRSKIKNPNSTIIHSPIQEFKIKQQDWKWYDISELAPVKQIDLLIIDGPPQPLQKLARYPALPLLWDKLNKGGIIVLDDANRADDRAMIERWCKEYPLEATFIPTEKGACILKIMED